MPLDDGCFRDPKLRKPAPEAATTWTSGRLPTGPEAKRGVCFCFVLHIYNNAIVLNSNDVFRKKTQYLRRMASQLAGYKVSPDGSGLLASR